MLDFKRNRASIGNPVPSYVQQLVGFVSLHAALAYAAIFLAAFLEAIPVLGTLVPGSTIVLALSALIPVGSLHLAPVLASAIAGAVIGEAIAYTIGHISERRILTSWPLSNYPAVVAQSEDFFHRYGIFAVFLARFVPPVRAIVPIVAGALGMPPRRFYPASVAACLLWAPAHVLPGLLAGSAAEQWGMKIEHYGLPLVGGIVAIGCLVVGAQYWRHRRRAAADSGR
jgi:membrane-associated protein